MVGALKRTSPGVLSPIFDKAPKRTGARSFWGVDGWWKRDVLRKACDGGER